MIFSYFQFFGFLGILAPPYCGIGATICIGREILCLPYAGYFSTLLNTYVYRRVSFSVVDIIITKEEKIFVQKSWWWKQQLFFFEGLAVWRLSRKQLKPVWAETVKNYPAQKLELLSPRNRYIGHQYGIWKIMGKAIFFVKKVLIDLSSC